MEVIKYLKNHSYEDLNKEFGIDVKKYNDRVVLNYNQINSPKFHPIVKECRGLILSKPDHKILCRSFDRFYNYREDQRTNEFDISKAVIEEKLDGSLINIYHDGIKWQAATRKMAFAEGTTVRGIKFEDLFIKGLGNDPNDVFKKIDRDLVIIFELVSPENRIVTPYETEEVYLLDVRERNKGTFYGHESTYYWDIPKGTKWRYPKKYTFSNLEEIMESIKKLSAMEEGYVAKIDTWRIKIKNPAYLAISHLRDNGVISEKRIIELIFMNEQDEYFSYFPEDRKYFEPYIKAFEKMLLDIENTYLNNKHIENQKEFALAINNCPAKSAIFAWRKGINIFDIFDGWSKSYKIKILNEYKEK